MSVTVRGELWILESGEKMCVKCMLGEKRVSSVCLLLVVAGGSADLAGCCV